MAYVDPFAPNYGSNRVVTAGVASASIDIERNDFTVRLVNTGSNVCYVKVGSGTITASTADLAVRAGSEVIIKKAVGADKLAYISASGTSLNIQTGNGGV